MPSRCRPQKMSRRPSPRSCRSPSLWRWRRIPMVIPQPPPALPVEPPPRNCRYQRADARYARFEFLGLKPLTRCVPQSVRTSRRVLTGTLYCFALRPCSRINRAWWSSKLALRPLYICSNGVGISASTNMASPERSATAQFTHAEFRIVCNFLNTDGSGSTQTPIQPSRSNNTAC